MNKNNDDTGRQLIGEKGVTYGLEIRKPPEKHSTVGRRVERVGTTKNAPRGQFNDTRKERKSIFGDEEDDEDEDGVTDVGRMVAVQAAAKKMDKKVLEMQAKALEEDANIFDYDAHYDDIQESRAAPKREEKIERQSKYIAHLLQTAEERKKEQEVMYEKKLAKEREVEDMVYGTTERFVTGAYKKKLEETEKWKQEQERKRKEEELEAVEKRGHMGHFYRNLFQSNVDYSSKAGTSEHVYKEGYSAGKAEDRSRPGHDAIPRSSSSLVGTAAAAMGTEKIKDSNRVDDKITETIETYDHHVRSKGNLGEPRRLEATTDDGEQQQERDDQTGGVKEGGRVKEGEGVKEGGRVKEGGGGHAEEGQRDDHDTGAAAENKKRERERKIADAKERYLSRKRQR